MDKAIKKYLGNINKAYRKGDATEHTYRTYLQTLIEELNPHITATNEPKREECGSPDYIITKEEIPIGYIEAKNVGSNLKKTDKTEQLDRYKKSLNNLILTDYLNFFFYLDGTKVAEVKIAEVDVFFKKDGYEIKPLEKNFDSFKNLLKEFCTYNGSTITSAPKLAKMMADKAKLMAEVLGNALISDETNKEDSTIQGQYQAFKEILIHDIKPAEFADVYAQTIAYGMLAARYHDDTLENFSRQEAAELIPKSNPFLRKLFGYIAGPDIDDRIKWVVDALAEVFSFANVHELMAIHGAKKQQEDPVIHFYETFLGEYSPKLKKARGVWYTPDPVVKFIVRAVDDILKTEFDLPDGLANTSKTKVKIDSQTIDKRTKTNKVQQEIDIHKVQVLDPATGTGTFLAEVIRKIHSNFEGQKGTWSKYVEEHLIPRVHGFELLMASYTMAHLKLDMLLNETGYKPKKQTRFGVYLTNSLDVTDHRVQELPFANWLTDEAQAANFIKRDTPVMVVLGNPPYSGISSNNGEWITSLIEDYKYVDGKHFGEKKHWLQDDYVKFIRYGEQFIEKTEKA